MNINELCALYDMDTRAYLPTSNTLRLLGSNDSYFLRAIKKKCESFGIKCIIDDAYIGPDSMRLYPTVIDVETYTGNVATLECWQDIDCQHHIGESCVSQAIADILSQYNIVGKHVVIIGRGHAVQGLKEILLANDATVTVCHSKTKGLYDITDIADILIIATPQLNDPIDMHGKDIIIDVGNAINDTSINNYTNKIGKLTISILLNRFVKCGE